jgi:uncharacterized protein YggE
MLIETPWGISAFGAGSVRVAPDLVRIRLMVTRVESSAEKSFDVTHKAVELVRKALHRHSVPDANVQRSRVDLRSDWDGYGAQRKLIGYRRSAGFSIELQELGRLQTLLVALVDAGAHQVDGVELTHSSAGAPVSHRSASAISCTSKGSARIVSESAHTPSSTHRPDSFRLATTIRASTSIVHIQRTPISA